MKMNKLWRDLYFHDSTIFWLTVIFYLLLKCQWYFLVFKKFMKSFFTASTLDYHHLYDFLYNTGQKATPAICSLLLKCIWIPYLNSSDIVMPPVGWFDIFNQSFTLLWFWTMMHLHQDHLQSYTALWATSSLSNEEVQDNATL